jgi:hypothetical protein
MLGMLARFLRGVWGKVGGEALWDGIVKVGLWVWGTGFVSSAVVFTLAWISDLPAVILYLAALDAFAVTVIVINGVQEIRERGKTQFAGEPLSRPPQTSPRDEANREKITVLFRSYGTPAYTDLHQLTNRLSARLDWSQNPRDAMIATLASNFAFAPCGDAATAMGKALKGADTHNINVLQQRLREFVKAYRRHVRWMHYIAPFSSPPLGEDHGYEGWREKHKLFRQELRILTATADFSQLRKESEGSWQDTVESAE